MTAVQAISKSSTHCPRALIQLAVWAVLLNLSAWAETGGPPPAAGPAADKAPEKTRDQFWWSDRFDLVRFTNPSRSTYYFISDPRAAATSEPSYLFLPPVPPPLGVDFPLLGTIAPGATAAPPELAAFVSEIFYPQLAARISADRLPKALWQQIQSYRAVRTDLQQDLRSRIAELKDADPGTSERQLAAFAAVQASPIAALEATAEKIRADLQPTGFFGLFAEEHATLPTQELRLESELMRHAAYYEKGLSPAQRHLLLDMAIELESQPDTNQTPPRTAAGSRLLHFSPETARITLPTGLPASLEKSIDDYVATKNGLKAELRGVLLSNEPASEACAQALKQLMLTQASRFASLEVMAEEIRRGLALLPNPPGPPAPPPLPAELMARISAYRRHKLELLRTLQGMLAGVRNVAETTPAQAAGKTNDPPSHPRTRAVMSEDPTGAQDRPMSLKDSVAEFNRKQTLLIAELNKELSGIRESLAEYVRTTGQPGDSKSIDDLLKDFENARQKQEVWDKYRDYQVAVLMPGLSPEQRRLLFDAAVEQLALPLPAGRMIR